jgi:peptide methionine sulfoxide reductase MsrA
MKKSNELVRIFSQVQDPRSHINKLHDIVENKVDYILALKENQKELLEQVQDEFRFCKNEVVNRYS